MPVNQGQITISDEVLIGKIYMIRGRKVMLDRDLAELYEVKAFRLREQVKRNIERFPENFMFRLTEKETDFMVSQNAIPSKKQKLTGHDDKIMLIFEYLKQLEQTKQEELEQKPMKVIEGYRKEKRSQKS
jgi:hypothetical protein